MKRKSEAINVEVAVDKCDHIGASKLEILQKARSIKKLWLNQKGEQEENLSVLLDYIFGKSDENPFQEMNDDIQAKYDAYDERIADLVKKVQASKFKKKINR